MSVQMVSNPVIGQFVYQPFSPQKVGVIRKVRKTKMWGADSFFVTVEWITPKGVRTSQKNVNADHLSDFDSLIADHRKKLNTHLASKKRLQSILRKGK
jgi:hypothetical protein